MTVRTYASPQAIKQALEQRLKTGSSTGSDFASRRQLLVFDRFLARAAAPGRSCPVTTVITVPRVRKERGSPRHENAISSSVPRRDHQERQVTPLSSNR